MLEPLRWAARGLRARERWKESREAGGETEQTRPGVLGMGPAKPSTLPLARKGGPGQVSPCSG